MNNKMVLTVKERDKVFHFDNFLDVWFYIESQNPSTKEVTAQEISDEEWIDYEDSQGDGS